LEQIPFRQGDARSAWLALFAGNDSSRIPVWRADSGILLGLEVRQTQSSRSHAASRRTIIAGFSGLKLRPTRIRHVLFDQQTPPPIQKFAQPMEFWQVQGSMRIDHADRSYKSVAVGLRAETLT